MKKCPCCGKELVLRRFSAYYGKYIEVDQCPNCQGIWFDKWEMVSLDPKEVKNLIQINESNINCSPDFCPVDGTKLSLLKDPFLPKEINIYYCPKCLGTWLPINELIKYKDFQEKKRSIKKENSEISKELEEKINTLLSSQEQRDEKEDIEEKMANLFSIIFIILKILSAFFRG